MSKDLYNKGMECFSYFSKGWCDVRNNKKLYFDIWRKANFTGLIKCYIKAFELYGRDGIAEGFGKQMDEILPDGRGTYDGSTKDWRSAYTISREFAIYRESQTGFELSSLAKACSESKITASKYLANYLLNFNQLINGQVVHPFKKVLELFQSQNDSITKDQIGDILEFNLNIATPASKRQQVNNFCNRIAGSGLLLTTGANGNHILIGTRYSLQDLLNACRVWEGTVEEFQEMNQDGYIDMISSPNKLIM
ncbi:hypothetical protein [Paenibacillus alginolyticus]|uniref:Uncharacterized protein n=1 Tax=Paenibacillus alginolyticus TaxID=59839 RepID=A0ABT4GJR8_9BACL|nr:hypothetical protein [Paenibacillus alginolyticus]MCY9696447.1 hypothetical protein [Paenibacillus alginolyticus]MEC0145269.1 hypothetical protein [Paenibacillus alginolyticus]